MDSTTKNMFPVMKLYDDIMGQLKCPECNVYWKREPIQMCEQGHTICNGCNKHILPSDENCTSQPSNVRNVALQNIVANTIYPCPFAEPGDRCDWSGNPFDIESHVRDRHDSVRVGGTGESEWIPLSLPLEGSFQKVIFTLGKIFFPISYFMDDNLCFLVFHVGHNEDSSNYRYDFKMQKSDEPEKSHSESGGICHNYQKNSGEVKVSGDYVMLPRVSIQKYLTDKKRDTAVSCDIKIKTTWEKEDVEMMETAENLKQPAESWEDKPDNKYFE